MHFLFHNDLVKELINDLMDVSNTKKKILKFMSYDLARNLKNRCDVLKASPHFLFLLNNPIFHFEQLTNNLKGYYSLRLNKNYRLIIEPKHIYTMVLEYEKCEEIYIEGVVDYHGKGKNNWLIP